MSDSKVVSVRMDEELLEEIRRLADDEHRAINGQVIMLLEKGIRQHEKEQEAIALLNANPSLTQRKRETS